MLWLLGKIIQSCLFGFIGYCFPRLLIALGFPVDAWVARVSAYLLPAGQALSNDAAFWLLALVVTLLLVAAEARWGLTGRLLKARTDAPGPQLAPVALSIATPQPAIRFDARKRDALDTLLDLFERPMLDAIKRGQKILPGFRSHLSDPKPYADEIRAVRLELMEKMNAIGLENDKYARYPDVQSKVPLEALWQVIHPMQDYAASIQNLGNVFPEEQRKIYGSRDYNVFYPKFQEFINLWEETVASLRAYRDQITNAPA